MKKIPVPKSQQTDKSDVCYLASQAEIKIIKMTMNEKYFPKRARFIITNKLIESAENVSTNFISANSIYPNTEEKLNIRQKYQIIGKSNLSALQHQLNVAARLFNIPSGILDDIFDLLNQINKKYENWFKSGKKILNREVIKRELKEEPGNNND